MDVMGWIGALRRRWILVIVLLLPTLFAAAAVAAQPGPYQARSQVALLPSKESSKLVGGNPFLNFTGSVFTTADLVSQEVMAPQVGQRLSARGFLSSYQVADDPLDGTVLDITVTGNSPSLVLRTLGAVTGAVRSTLTAVQGNVKPTAQITSIVLSTDLQAALMVTHKARKVLAVLGAGLAITIGLPLLVDAIAARRNRDDADEDAGRYPVARPRAPEPAMDGAPGRHGR